MIRRLLVANRGEIAVRILRTARSLGLETVAVYSDADAHSMHVSMADRAYRLGPAPSLESYLLIPKLIDIAQLSGAHALHPGYGFLSESLELAQACEASGVIFLGPGTRALAAMALKHDAKRLMHQAGVPTLPSVDVPDPKHPPLEALRALPWPLLIKPVAGGGGKGMHQVHEEKDLIPLLHLASEEAISSFNDGRLMVEPYLDGARHIEIQVLGDCHGNLITLGSRDCSLQRRRQKVIEECPAPNLDPDQLSAMEDAALQAARAVDYSYAGTIEFLFDPRGAFYFMEMNTRLQVEHPVTECVYGVDLVSWQIRIGGGASLKDLELKPSGHAIEVRLNAEDPSRQFLPSQGLLEVFEFPSEPWIRVDAGFRAGDRVSPYYDSLLAKVIAYGDTREMARVRLIAALRQTRVHGVQTNAAFLLSLLSSEDFIHARADVRYVDRHPEHTPPIEPSALEYAAAAIACQYAQVGSDNPWEHPDLFPYGKALQRRVHFVYPETLSMQLIGNGLGDFELRSDRGDFFHITYVQRKGDELELHVGGGRHRFKIWQRDASLVLWGDRGKYLFKLEDARTASQASEATGALVAPMPGTVVALHAALGDCVEEGTPLVVLEAMKMRHVLHAPFQGYIHSLDVHIGSMVLEGQRLMMLEIQRDDTPQ